METELWADSLSLEVKQPESGHLVLISLDNGVLRTQEWRVFFLHSVRVPTQVPPQTAVTNGDAWGGDLAEITSSSGNRSVFDTEIPLLGISLKE